jgi:hypothetical protein
LEVLFRVPEIIFRVLEIIFGVAHKINAVVNDSLGRKIKIFEVTEI